MRPKHKVTGCARFIIFFIIFIPLVYFGAAYFRGEDGVQELKNLYYKIIGKTPASTTTHDDPGTYKIEDLQEELDKAKVEIRELKEIIKQKDKEINTLKSGG